MDPAALTEMVESIKEHGIIQPPTFQVGERGLLTNVTGERRCAAAVKAYQQYEAKLNPPKKLQAPASDWQGKTPSMP